MTLDVAGCGAGAASVAVQGGCIVVAVPANTPTDSVQVAFFDTRSAAPVHLPQCVAACRLAARKLDLVGTLLTVPAIVAAEP